MSGGVDSAVAAQLALEAGDDVVAVTLELWADPATDGERSCCSPQAVVGARALAQRMGIPHLTLDLREPLPRPRSWTTSSPSTRAGRTPNPCVRCNGLVRFDAMLELAERLGAARLATGHYARIARDADGPLVRAAADPAKDQTYMLAAPRAAELERLWFPLGELAKPEVRELAREAGLPVADKPESQDLCFLAGLGGTAFMRRHADERARAAAGEIVDADGRVLGRHDGHTRFTVGQRRGIGVAGAEPLYVLEKDAESNRVVVGPRAALATRRVALAPRAPAPRAATRSSRSSCATARSRRLPRRGRAGAGEHAQLELELERRSAASRRARPPACWPATASSAGARSRPTARDAAQERSRAA